MKFLTRFPARLAWFGLLAAAAAVATPALANDWPQWQGPDRDAKSAEQGLLPQWPDGGPPLAWKATDLGGGDSAPAIAGGVVYGMSARDGDEIVWALSESDGSELWTARLGPAFDQSFPQSKEGPGGTPTVDGDRVYAIGMGGVVSCLETAGGDIVWQRDMHEEFGGAVPAWSFRESPLVDGDKLICTPGGRDAMMVALDKQTGATLWTCADPDARDDNAEEGESGGRRPRIPESGAAYSSVIAIDFEGQRQYVQMTATSLVGVSADGQLLWQYQRPANRMRINCSTPIYQDGLVFASSAYGNGGGAVRLSRDADGGVTAEEVYFTSKMQNHHGGMIVLDGVLYGANGGNGGGFLSALDFATGDVIWREREAPKGGLAYADGRLYLRGEGGELVLIEPSRDEYRERGRFQQPDRTDKPAWAHPVVANGRLYVRDQGAMYVYDVAE
ncbi:Outer membrane protein assembly factor BamB precursor [Posidoniimonas polymericola]|uniref:Outer membrane protein assembly factor BamB n=1 Tax=Posidoniimonas polymericola TaxID=2528002 RepID=A0A5C5XU73_9BACT|nr:PQQ-like beta-propeller repeat protein [Posidoniimonas polymericola]TWT66777.1 Outer membrane protein assembly factor BamB precursor [Posidoniimonas polymericola]